MNNLTPADVYFGRGQTILLERERIKRKTIEHRRLQHRVVGAKDRKTNQVRAAVVGSTDAKTLQGFVGDHAASDATVYTDEASAYKGIPQDHESVTHSVGEYVRGMVHTNGIESLEKQIKGLSATDCSRLAWLLLNIGNSERALDVAKTGIQRESSNEYCQSLILNLESH